MNILITGGCGFVGSNLSSYSLAQGARLTVVDSLSRFGARENLAFLNSRGHFEFCELDIRNSVAVADVIKRVMPEAIFHLAGQVAMTTSLSDPRYDFEVNALGTLNLLEAVRNYSPDSSVLYASTNKVYGDLLQYNYTEGQKRYTCNEYPRGFDEAVPLDFHSPYGCSKGSADQYVLDYHRMFGIRAAVFRHSSMYGGRQFATVDQGWVGWFCQKSVEAKSGAGSIFTISGNGKQVRDLLHVDDVTRLYYSAAESMESVSGHAFNVGGGIENSLSLLELFDILEEINGCHLQFERKAPRESDQLVFVADTAKLSKLVGWQPRIAALDGIRSMLDWLVSGRSSF